jgi:hypothetical protein
MAEIGAASPQSPKLYPETKHGGAPGKAGGGKKAKGGPKPSFAGGGKKAKESFGLSFVEDTGNNSPRSAISGRSTSAAENRGRRGRHGPNKYHVDRSTTSAAKPPRGRISSYRHLKSAARLCDSAAPKAGAWAVPRFVRNLARRSREGARAASEAFLVATLRPCLPTAPPEKRPPVCQPFFQPRPPADWDGALGC